IKMITLSPEWDDSISFIEKATKSGVKVFIGHTKANSSQIHEAVKAGAVLSTHLGNGANLTLPRHPNYIWDQLAEDSLWTSVISDGHHLPSNVLRVFQKVKLDKLILVSDSVALTGKPPGEYLTSIGGEVTLTPSGRLHLKNNPNLLAGSSQSLLQGIQRCINQGITSKAEAIKKASIYPAALMDLFVKEGLPNNALADIITINTEGDEWKIEKLFKKGVQMLCEW